MAHRFVQYEVDGEERWGIWSTVVEDWIYYDCSGTDIIEIEAEKAAKRRRQKVARRILEIQQGEDPYIGGGPKENDINDLEEYEHD